MGCPADPPAHDIAGVDVDHEGHVDKAGPGRDVSEVSDPQPVRRRRVELTVHLVEWAQRRLVADRRAYRLAADHALKTEFAHQPLDSASGDLKPFAPHLPPHLAHPVNAKVLGMDPPDRLDPIIPAMRVDERDHRLNGRSSSARAKYALALRRISLA